MSQMDDREWVRGYTAKLIAGNWEIMINNEIILKEAIYGECYLLSLLQWKRFHWGEARQPGWMKECHPAVTARTAQLLKPSCG